MLRDKRFFLICAAALVDPLTMSSIGPLVPALKTTFNVTVELVALSVSFHMIPFSILCLFSGTLSDLYYRPKIMVFGLLFSFGGSLLGAIAPNILIFSLSRTLQGIGSSLIMPISLALLGDLIPGKALGRTMGMYGVILGLSSSFGPLIGGYLALIGWRILEVVLATYSITVAILVAMTFGIREGSQKKLASLSFLFTQFKQITGNRNVILMSLSGFLLFFTYQGMQPLISDTLSLPPLLLRDNEIGLIFSIAGFAGVVFSFFGGFLVDKVGGRKTTAISFLMMIPSQFFLSLANSYWAYIVGLLLIQGFQRSAWCSVQTLVIQSLPKAKGTASSAYNFTRFLGYGTAPAVLTTIYVAQGLNSVIIFNIVLLFIGILFAFLAHPEGVSQKKVAP